VDDDAVARNMVAAMSDSPATASSLRRGTHGARDVAASARGARLGHRVPSTLFATAPALHLRHCARLRCDVFVVAFLVHKSSVDIERWSWTQTVGAACVRSNGWIAVAHARRFDHATFRPLVTYSCGRCRASVTTLTGIWDRRWLLRTGRVATRHRASQQRRNLPVELRGGGPRLSHRPSV